MEESGVERRERCVVIRRKRRGVRMERCGVIRKRRDVRIIIIIIVFSLTALRRAKERSFILYGYTNCGTRSLTHGNSNIEIGQRNRGRNQAEKSEY